MGSDPISNTARKDPILLSSIRIMSADLGPVPVNAGAAESLPGQLLGHLLGAELGAHKHQGFGRAGPSQLRHQPALLLLPRGEHKPLAHVGAGAAHHPHGQQQVVRLQELFGRCANGGRDCGGHHHGGPAAGAGH